MRQKIIIYTLYIFIIALLQSTVLNYIQIFGIKPNQMIVFIITVALVRGNLEGAVIGLLCGLMQDIASGKILGLYALLGFLLGYAAGSVNKRFYRDNLFVALFITFAATVVYEFLLVSVTVFINGQVDIWFAISRIILPEAAYNSIISIFVYLFVIRINLLFEAKEKSSRKY